MTYTTNYNLKKPDTTDLVDIGDLNDNADTIDAALAGKQDTLTFDPSPIASSSNPVTSGGVKTALDAKQNTLIAGTNITITGDTISATGGGGGGGSAPTTLTVTLAAANWSSNTITVTATGVAASNLVMVAPAPSSYTDYTAANIRATAQTTDSLTFTCDTEPSSNITVNVVIWG